MTLKCHINVGFLPFTNPDVTCCLHLLAYFFFVKSSSSGMLGITRYALWQQRHTCCAFMAFVLKNRSPKKVKKKKFTCGFVTHIVIPTSWMRSAVLASGGGLTFAWDHETNLTKIDQSVYDSSSHRMTKRKGGKKTAPRRQVWRKWSHTADARKRSWREPQHPWKDVSVSLHGT